MTVGQRIRECRTTRGMTQVELADKANIAKQTLYKYENDIVTNIPSDKIETIADLLNVSPAYLMGWAESPEPPQTVRYTLTDAEAEIIRKYRALDAYDKVRIEERIDEMLEKKTSRMEGDVNVG